MENWVILAFEKNSKVWNKAQKRVKNSKLKGVFGLFLGLRGRTVLDALHPIIPLIYSLYHPPHSLIRSFTQSLIRSFTHPLNNKQHSPNINSLLLTTKPTKRSKKFARVLFSYQHLVLTNTLFCSSISYQHLQPTNTFTSITNTSIQIKPRLNITHTTLTQFKLHSNH